LEASLVGLQPEYVQRCRGEDWERQRTTGQPGEHRCLQMVSSMSLRERGGGHGNWAGPSEEGDEGNGVGLDGVGLTVVGHGLRGRAWLVVMTPRVSLVGGEREPRASRWTVTQRYEWGGMEREDVVGGLRRRRIKV
jgi:hypothetical protein